MIEPTPFRRFLSSYCESKLAVAAFVLLIVILFIALFAPLISPQDPYDLRQLDVIDARLEPGTKLGNGNTALLGTDDQGRDMLSGIFYGMRISLFVGFVSTLLALLIGAIVGMTAAWLGGRTDNFLMRIADIQLSFPPILIALILLALLGQGLGKIITALVTVQWAYYARTIRGAALVERRSEYIEAAQVLALPASRIVFRHLLPNCMPPLIVIATVQVASAITLEATLSFLGLGLPITEPSLGLLIANGFNYLMSGKYWISMYPGVALVLIAQRRSFLQPRIQHVAQLIRHQIDRNHH